MLLTRGEVIAQPASKLKENPFWVDWHLGIHLPLPRRAQQPAKREVTKIGKQKTSAGH
jgi:hypothetical protein